MNSAEKRAAILRQMTELKHIQPAVSNAPAPIAIVGLSGYLPGCMDVRSFWQALDKDENLITLVPEERMPGKRWGGVIPDIKGFDAGFFRVLPGEADSMDPRRRLLLMSVYHAFEDAGYAPQSMKGSMTGVFVAIEEDEYAQCMLASGHSAADGSIRSSSLVANEVSYFFDLRGPSEVVNTMCSGAAVAVHRAVKALRSGEISAAVVGAANLMLQEDTFNYLSATGQLSESGVVHSFGKDASGFVRADGVASILLKPLSAAIADGDDIYALVRHTSVNYNGQGGTSMAAPNVPAHADLISRCYTEAGIDPRQVSYIEAQGMGNPVADMAEWEACNRGLKAAAKVREAGLVTGSCRVSTLKPMMGHMHSASALGALLKVIRSLQTNTIHGIQGLNEVNPDLELEGQPCRLLAATEEWAVENFPRLAGIHSYGSGGNNAHILIEEYKAAPVAVVAGPLVFELSAMTEEQCKTIALNLADHVEANANIDLHSVAYTLRVGRDKMKYRAQIVASSREEFVKKARGFEVEKGVVSGSVSEGVSGYVSGSVNEGVSEVAGGVAVKASRVHLPGYPFDRKPYWMKSATVATVNGAEEAVRDVLSRALHVTPKAIDLEQDFSTLGFDSMLVRQMVHRLDKDHGIKVETAALFEYTTPAALIAYIGERPVAKAVKSDTSNNQEPIAIIGLSGKFPQAEDVDQFWENMLAGKNCVSEVPAERWSLAAHFEPDMDQADKTGKSYGKWGGFLKDAFLFDNLFFSISPAEAAMMSPKERLFIHSCYHTLEDAGYTPKRLSDEKVGVFAGVTRSGIDPYQVSMFTVPNRVSYLFNFRGPSLAIDTACSSSLIALHEACQHIHAGECTMAVAGGVHLFLDTSHFAMLSSMHMLSPDGLCRSFGESANGMVPGEGVGTVLLKPLSRAVADGDHIYGVIRSSATNHGGKANGFTVPNPRAHADLIRFALEKAKVSARAISYVEAHGTGTSLGDPIEIRGLSEAFKQDTTDTGFCSVGSVKSHIGHLEAAAGISGLMRILMQMKHGIIAPTLHAERSNAAIDFENSPFYVQREAAPWEGHKLAALSSFGAGGSNAHLIIEEYIAPVVEVAVEEPVVIVLSAKNAGQLKKKAAELLRRLGEGVVRLADVAYTLQVGRELMKQRLVFAASNIQEVKLTLELFVAGQPVASDEGLLKEWTGKARRVSLPGHPFEGEYYGLPSKGDEVRFSGEEFFLTDHVVNGKKILPAVMYLEMMRAAAGSTTLSIKNVGWAQPVVADGPVTLQLENKDGLVVIRQGETVFCQGKVETADIAVAPSIELMKAGVRWTADELYTLYDRIGIHYGPAHRPIRELWVGPQGVLARLVMPEGLGDGQLVLHPSMMDGAAQLVLPLLAGDPNATDLSLAIPFALDKLEVFGHCGTNMWARVRQVDEGTVDIDLSDEAGVVVARMKGFKVRMVQQRTKGLLLLEPVWEERSILGSGVDYAKSVVIRQGEDDSSEEIVRVFLALQDVIRERVSGKILVQVIVKDDLMRRAVSGVLKTLRLEQPSIVAQVIETTEETLLPANGQQPEDVEIKYLDGVRMVRVLREFASTGDVRPGWKKDGVYLITGGAGGLGKLFAKEIVEAGGKVVLAGRTRLALSGDYRVADVTDARSVSELVAGVIKDYGRLDGVIHGAGALKDGWLINKTEAGIRALMAPKVQGLINLDLATKDIALEHFIVLSSAASLMGNPGQSDYAAANGFMDGYMHQRNALVAAGQRSGFSCSMNWALWKEGGMQVDQAFEEQLQATTGMCAMETADGMRALYRVLASRQEQMMVVAGDVKMLRRACLEAPKVVKESSVTEGSAVDEDAAVKYFKKVLAGVIKLSPERIDENLDMDNYGIDSIMVMKMTNELEKVFGSLSKTLFFEYRNIKELTQYFINEHGARLEGVIGVVTKKVVAKKELVKPVARKPDGALDIAIVGVAGRYPQARNLREFWENLRGGKNSVTEVPAGRWDHSVYFDEQKGKPGKTYTKWGGFLDGIDEFDPLFFNIAPKEALALDPQERLFLQCAYEVMEDAGYSRATLGAKGANIGVYVGVMWEEYHLYAAQEQALGRSLVLSSSPSSIANRVSYFLNLQGPSLAVDTMCSSSLTSIHLACQSLLLGECSAAIAGGVNLSLHPNKFLVLGHGRYASSKGLCESFGEGGDGYVPGEGVGAVLLKPLAQAIADKDHIYGVIKGTAVNHGGKVNGFTVPNPTAQAAVIERAMSMTGFDSRHVSYIEAHGTGTSLGDPIEITALSKAFNTKEKGFCAIGSAKSNIGHCESAAGIAGVTKVLLQMKHGMLAPSLHSATLNPNIDFTNTPFVVQRELAPWSVEGPRRAGVSSFGAGGSNAHIVIEEYTAEVSRVEVDKVIIPLSAKNEERLKVYAGLLLKSLTGVEDLASMAYTLQVGREAMEERVVFEVSSINELSEKLTAFVERGEAARKCTMEMGVLWLNGFEVDWSKLYDGGETPQKMSLPTYPFLQDRYWPKTGLPVATDTVLHPLVHRNTSTFSKQQFNSTFTGREFFLRDHRVDGDKLLPGVAYLEMVHFAMKAAGRKNGSGVRMENLIWAQPLMVNGHPESVDIDLLPGDNDTVSFAIGDAEVVYSRGIARYVETGKPAAIDIATLRAQMSRRILDAEDCYTLFGRAGIEYGPAQRAVKQIYIGSGQLLAELQLPEIVAGTLDDYELHPSLMDAALQSIIGFLDGEREGALAIPFAIGSVEVLNRCTPHMWAYTKQGRTPTSYDIELCDDAGRVCVRIGDYSTRILRKDNNDHILMMRPRWVADDLSDRSAGDVKVLEIHANAVSEVFHMVKQLLGARLQRTTLLKVVGASTHLPVTALLKTAALENPLFSGQVVVNGVGQSIVLEEYHAPAAAPIWKDGGVYLITGGAGGLGKVFAKEIASAGGKVVLTGRSALSFEGVDYRVADVTDILSVERLVRGIVSDYGRLDGVIHSAGVLRDGWLMNKTEADILAVMAPKVQGARNLDAATKHIALDCMIFCSSTAAVTGNMGQADYAMANAFMDAFAGERAYMVEKGLRHGKTMSMNWPLWEEGGMDVGETVKKAFFEHIGMAPLQTAAAFGALYKAMASDGYQMMVFQGDLQKLRSTFLAPKKEVAVPKASIEGEKGVVVASAAIGREKGVVVAKVPVGGKAEATAYLKGILSAAIGLPADQISSNKPMEEYGIDSVMVMGMTNELEKVFGSLPKTLFFEYSTIGELTDYFVERHGEKFGARVEDVVVARVEEKEVANEVEVGPAKVGRDIAIVGLAGRYPKARNLEAFWEVLTTGTNCVTEIPLSRWDHDPYFDKEKNKPGKTYGRWGGFVDGADEFDPLFFGISAGEAAVMDPQERLFLQCAYETMEDAGYARGPLRNVGVYVGVMWDEYQLYGPQETALGNPTVLSGVTGSIANRVSYFYNFSGPSLAVNTMCSSSLTAIHLACQSVLQGECEAALAGGVNLSLHPNKYMALGHGSFLSSKGLCEAFGAGGDGYVPGEGVGAVLIKPLEQAIRDHDHIYGVIKGSAINHGGKTNGYTVPNPKAQGNVIGKAIKAAGFEPGSISYLEAHGTGTSLGDPIEIAGLQRAFGTDKGHGCRIGSVKSNIGHCESASGIAGLTKVLLQLKHGMLAPSLHSATLNPNIDFANSPFIVQRELTEWTGAYPRRAGVSSFGAGGGNAHMLIEEYAAPVMPVPASGQRVWVVLSARSEQQLTDVASNLLEWARTAAEESLSDMAYTLQVGREGMKYRLAVEVGSIAELCMLLGSYVNGQQPANILTGRVYDEAGEGQSAVDWVKGALVNWEELYRSGRHPRRISLPTYPFARERYWYEVQPAAEIDEEFVEEVISYEVAADAIVYKLKTMVAAIVKYPVDQIDPKDALENYGIDSTMILRFNKELTAIYGELPATLLYEYQSIEALAGFLGKQRAPVRTSRRVSKKREYVKRENTRKESTKREGVAIIGIHGRFPGAKDLDQFWENLKNGVDSIIEIPADRWAIEPGQKDSKWGGFIDGVTEFDPKFFNVTPKEVRGTDPHIRLFVESSWRVLEDAGYTKKRIQELYKGNVGVYAGMTRTGFMFYAPELLANEHYGVNPMSAVANKVSYLLDLKGPSVPVDTMCSSSLTAIHEACESLLAGHCEMAIAGGVNLLLHPNEYLLLQKNNFLASDGRCKSFGTGGDGYVPGEGVGTVLLKPLSKAIADGDHIYAVVRGTSINHGGKTNGYTVPNPVAQGDLIRHALDLANVNARNVSYIEAHGTGTSLGDPIEVTGLTQAFAKDTNDLQYCSLGSAKSNIGHLEAAAGIAGIAKILLQMQHGMLAPSLHSAQTNPNINFSKTPFYVQQKLQPWNTDGSRIAGISSFGAGGSNAHILIEEYVGGVHSGKNDEPVLFVLSAKTEERLKVYAKDMLQALKGDENLADVAYTLQVGREAMEVRMGVEVNSIKELRDVLSAYVTGAVSSREIYKGNVKDHKDTITLLSSDKDIETAVDAWMATGKYGKLLGLWVKGYDVPWTMRGRIVKLPGYPFEQKKYWITDKDRLFGDTVVGVAPVAVKDPFELLSYEEKWVEKSARSRVKEAGVMPGAVVCFSKTKFLGEGVVYVEEPMDDYTQLFKGLGPIDAVVYGRALENNGVVTDYKELFHIAQAVCKGGVKQLLFAGQWSSADSIERCYLESWMGFERSLRMIIPGVLVKGLYKEAVGVDLNDWAKLIRSEMNGEKGSVLYKDGKRHMSQIISANIDNGAPLLRPKATYLITGGTGSLGLLLARHLARQYGANLILTGRSAPNTEKLDPIRELGGKVFYIQADVTDRLRMEEGLALARREFGPIHGIVHAAGVVGSKTFTEKSYEEFAGIMAPKIGGTVLLDELTSKDPLEFVAYFASSSAILGDFAACDYSIANRFETLYAYHRTNGKTIAINWPLWRDGGMDLGDDENTKMYLKSSGQRLLGAEEGMELFEKLLASQATQRLVIAGDRKRVDRFLGVNAAERAPEPDEAAIIGNQLANVEDVRVVANAPVVAETPGIVEEAAGSIEDQLIDLVCRAQQIAREDIVTSENLVDMGFDSISLSSLALSMTHHFGIEIAPAVFFSYSSIDQLTAFLQTTLS